MRSVVPLAVVCGVLALVTGCASDAASVAEEGPGAASTTQSRTTQSRPTQAPATQTPATTPLSGPDAIVTDWPAEAAPVHGATVWAVYLAVGPAGDPELAEATEFLESRGYSAGVGELACDEGAAEALGRDPQELAVAAYFDRRADAGDFVAMLKPTGSTPETSRGFVEMLRVTRFCLD